MAHSSQDEVLVVILVAEELTGASRFRTMIKLLLQNQWQSLWRRDALSQLDRSLAEALSSGRLAFVGFPP